jgi:hypothetical protein
MLYAYQLGRIIAEFVLISRGFYINISETLTKPVSSNFGLPFSWYSAKGKAESQNPTFLGYGRPFRASIKLIKQC